LNLIEFLLKHGASRCIQEFKGDVYKIRTLEDFNYVEGGQDKGMLSEY
jgi:hypothetical protein